jgi:hypothetical protein
LSPIPGVRKNHDVNAALNEDVDTMDDELVYIIRRVASGVPVALDPHITTAAIYPVTGHPVSMCVRRRNVGSGNPDVASAIPSVIAGTPNPTWMRRRWHNFNGGRRRRSNPNNDLRSSRHTERKKAAANCCKHLLLHDVQLHYGENSSFKSIFLLP